MDDSGADLRHRLRPQRLGLGLARSGRRVAARAGPVWCGDRSAGATTVCFFGGLRWLEQLGRGRHSDGPVSAYGTVQPGRPFREHGRQLGVERRPAHHPLGPGGGGGGGGGGGIRNPTEAGRAEARRTRGDLRPRGSASTEPCCPARDYLGPCGMGRPTARDGKAEAQSRSSEGFHRH